MGPLTTPKKGREVGSVDPWTPTSNLKMLISAASPDIRNREKELGKDADRRECVNSAQVRKQTQKDDVHVCVCLNKLILTMCVFFPGRILKLEKILKDGSAGRKRAWVCSVINFSPVTQIVQILQRTTTSVWMTLPLS